MILEDEEKCPPPIRLSQKISESQPKKSFVASMPTVFFVFFSFPTRGRAVEMRRQIACPFHFSPPPSLPRRYLRRPFPALLAADLTRHTPDTADRSPPSLSFHSHYCHICPTAEQNRTSSTLQLRPHVTHILSHGGATRSMGITGGMQETDCDRRPQDGPHFLPPSLPLFVIFFIPPHSMIAKKRPHISQPGIELSIWKSSTTRRKNHSV